MKRVKLSIRDFAFPVPRTGSIDALSGYGRATQAGIETHQRVQELRLSEHHNYVAEKSITHEFERDGYVFEVGGRMDGFFEQSPPRIEEIKSSFSCTELKKRLEKNKEDHPYCLQLRTYGYFHWLQTGEQPKLHFHLVSTRNSERDDLEIELDPESYKAWLELRFEELVREAKNAEQRAARRRKVASNMEFPFPAPRPGQLDLIATVEQGMKDDKRMLVQAPTGLGKTVGVLYPALKEALSRGQRVIYVTPKNSQHSVAEDAVKKLQETGAKVRSLTLTAKGKICFKNEPLCNPTYCEYAKDHYTKVAEHQVLEKISKKRKLTAKTFQNLGEEFQVCPFELQLDSATDVDTVICDYNYVFAPRSAFAGLKDTGLDQDGKPNLVIDEAHNLPARAMDYYSPTLSSQALERMKEGLDLLPKRFQKEMEDSISSCIETIMSCRPEGCEKPVQIEIQRGRFIEQESELRALLSRYLESEAEIQAGDPVLRLCFYWSEFTSALEIAAASKKGEFFTSFSPFPHKGSIKITCCDASHFLEKAYDDYNQVVGFSATLKPFDYYSELTGLSRKALKTAEFASPFPKNRRKLIIIPQLSSKYSERARNTPRFAEAIRRITEIKKGNYLIFFPSFELMERVLEQFEAPIGFTVLRQERSMRNSDAQSILDHLREAQAPTLLFAVQGGIFSEGVDYPGEMIIGALIIGTALPVFDLERELMREYYERNYDSGFDYAYTFPAMAKAVQAAGRVIRSETDRGIIILMDDRFLNPSYSKSLPQDWFQDNPRELVSQSILQEITRFWQETNP